MKNNKGFTLMEIIITLALGCIVITLIGSFFISNINSYKRICDSNEIKDQAQFITVYFDEYASQSSGICVVKGEEGESFLNSKDPLFIKEIEFKCKNSKLIMNTNFQIKNNNDIFFNRHSELGTYLDRIQISPLGEKTSYKNCNGINYKMFFSKNNSSFTVESTVYFRNKIGL